MNKDLLIGINRIGIVLNLIASFMIAPELIGIPRIKRFETWLENSLSSTKSRIDNIESKIRDTLKNTVLGLVPGCVFALPFLCILVCLFGSIWAFDHQSTLLAGVLILLIYGSLVFFTSPFFVQSRPEYRAYHGNGAPQPLGHKSYEKAQADYEEYRRRTTTRRGRIVQVFSILVLGPLLILAAVLLSIPAISVFILAMASLYLVLLILYSISGALSALRKNLEGDDRLRAILVSWGVVFLILGNTFQLVGTF